MVSVIIFFLIAFIVQATAQGMPAKFTAITQNFHARAGRQVGRHSVVPFAINTRPRLNSAKVEKRIAWLNENGSLQSDLDFEKTMEVGADVGVRCTMEVLKRLEKYADSINNPTGWVLTALHKSKNTTMGERIRGVNYLDEAKLRGRIAWLNCNGGLKSDLHFDKIMEAGADVDAKLQDILAVLEKLEKNADSIKDSTNWVRNSLRRINVNDTKLKTRIGWLNKYGGLRKGLRYAKIAEAAVGVEHDYIMWVLKYLKRHADNISQPQSWVEMALRRDDASRLRKRVGWLNKAGCLKQNLSYDVIAQAASGVDINYTMKILQKLERDAHRIQVPDTWVCHSLLPHIMDDAKLRKRISWLNYHADLPEELNYDKIAEAAAGVDSNYVMEVLRQLEESADRIESTNAWVLKAFLKSEVSDTKLRQRIQWLNKRGGLQEKLDYDMIAEAATGVNPRYIMNAFGRLEERADTIVDPNDYIISELLQANSRGSAKSGVRQARPGESAELDVNFLAQASTDVITGLAATLVGLFAGGGVIFAALCFCKRASYASEDLFLVV